MNIVLWSRMGAIELESHWWLSIIIWFRNRFACTRIDFVLVICDCITGVSPGEHNCRNASAKTNNVICSSHTWYHHQNYTYHTMSNWYKNVYHRRLLWCVILSIWHLYRSICILQNVHSFAIIYSILRFIDDCLRQFEWMISIGMKNIT